jgi:hypothetical protein
MNVRCFLKQPLNHNVTHISFPIVNTAPENDTYLSTIGDNITQFQRHAMGLEVPIFLLQMLPICHRETLGESDDNSGKKHANWYRFWSKACKRVFAEIDPHLRTALCSFPLAFIPIFMNSLTLHHLLGSKYPFEWPLQHHHGLIWSLTHDPVVQVSGILIALGFLFCGVEKQQKLGEIKRVRFQFDV